MHRDLIDRLEHLHRDDDGFCETCRFDAPPWYDERYCYPCPTLKVVRELAAPELRLVQ